MARSPTHKSLNVYLNGRLVGEFNRATSGAIDFSYAPQWLSWDNAIPVSISLPLREDRYIGDPVSAVFENLLPDNDDVRRRVAERFHANGTDAFNLLTAIGRDCVGALQFLPDDVVPGPAGAIEARAVDDTEIASIVANLAINPLGLGVDQDFRISIAGAQSKTALLFWRGQWHVPHGTTATTHIIKPQIGHLPNGIDLTNSVENEHFCLEIAAALGLPVTKSRIVDFAGRHVLAVERFDRLWTRNGRLLRVPQEDCCQALSVPPTRKYESEGGPGYRKLDELLKGSDTPDIDRKSLLKSQIVFWLLGATDGHAKNFSIALAPGGRFHLTPLYDILSAQPAMDAGRIKRNQMKLAMAIGNNRHYAIHSVVGRHFAQTAKACGLPDKVFKEIVDELMDTTAGKVAQVCATLTKSVPEILAASISKGVLSRLRNLPLPATANL